MEDKLSGNLLKYDQHFLINEEILDLISQTIGDMSNSSVLEIGGGKGILTQKIIEKNPKSFTCVEVDSEMIQHLKPLFSNTKYNLEYSNAIDYLHKSLREEFDIIVGNIPYGISEPLYTQFYFLLPKKIILLESHKTTRTLIEKQNTKQSILINVLYSIKCIKIVEGDNFEPITKTKSSIIKLKLREYSSKTEFEKFLTHLTKRYNQTFFNSCVYSLAQMLEVGKKEIKNKLKEFNIEISTKRIDTISNEEFIVTITKIEESFFNI